MDTTNPHRIEVTINNGGYIEGVMKCDAPEGAECRLWCEDGCEQAGPEHSTYHALSDQGYCCATEGWFDDDIFGCYSGGLEQIRSAAVVLEWEGDGYLWHYDVPTSPDSGREADQ